MSRLLVSVAVVGAFSCGDNIKVGNGNTDAGGTSGADAAVDASTDGGGGGIDAGSGGSGGSGSGGSGSSGSGSGSATSGAFACHGDSMPSVAAEVTLSGKIDTVGLGGVAADGNAAVNVCIDPGTPTNLCIADDLLGSDETNAAGSFTGGPFATDGSAIHAYLEVPPAALSGDYTVLAFDGAPLFADATAPTAYVIPTLANTELGCSNTDEDGILLVAATDCAGAVLANAAAIHVSVTQQNSSGSAIAAGSTPVTVVSKLGSAATPPALDGVYLVCNVPAGEVTVSVRYTGSGTGSGSAGIEFLPAKALSVGGDLTEVAVRPGY